MAALWCFLGAWRTFHAYAFILFLACYDDGMKK